MEKEIQQITKGLTVSQQEQSNLPAHLQKISDSMAPEEKAILKAKYILPRFPDMPAVDLPRHAKGLLFRIHTITGWKLPEDDLFLNTLVSEFSKYLVEQCADLNPEEVSYAVRNHALEVKDWGKSMNLSLIDEPIRSYRERRCAVSEFEEARKKALDASKTKELPAGECDWSEQWEQIKEGAKNGKIDNVIILTPVYDWLEREGLLDLDRDEKIQALRECREEYIRELAVRISEGYREQDLLEATKAPDWMLREEIMPRIRNMAKIKAVRMLALSETL